MSVLPAIWVFTAMASAVPHVIADRPIPAIDNAIDVRWIDAEHVIVSDHQKGIARINVAGDVSIAWLDGWPKPSGPGTGYFHLALSDDYLMASDFCLVMQWRRRTAESPMQRWIWEYIADVDVDGDRLLLTGLHRDDKGNFAKDGALAWLGKLSGGEASLRPILPFRSLNAASGCAGFDLGKVRFLKDGSFIVVPGSDPGVYLFSSEGRVQRLWESAALGIDVNCDFEMEEKSLLATKPLARNQWINRRPIIDEVIDTPSGPALIIRKVTGETTHWDLLLLNGPKPTAQSLPITSPSPWAHLSADVRGNRVVFLIGDKEKLDGGAPARLITMSW